MTCTCNCSFYLSWLLNALTINWPFLLPKDEKYLRRNVNRKANTKLFFGYFQSINNLDDTLMGYSWPIQNNAHNLKMIESLAHGYSYERIQ